VRHLSRVVGLLLFVSAVASAQTPARAPANSATPPSGWQWTVSNLTRLEAWSFFEPRPGGGDPDSLFVGNRLRLGISKTWRRVDIAGALQFVQFRGLPRRAFGPGFLGTGALYYEHSGKTDSRGIYVPALNAHIRLWRGVTIVGGRFGYASGAESPSGHQGIEAVKRARLDGRLIGEFEWSMYQRAFDGVRGDIDRQAWHASAAWMRPTQGGFEEDAGASAGPIELAALTVTLRPGVMLPATDVAAFVYTYSDDRPVTARPDNTGRTGNRVRATISTIGGSAVGSYPAGNGDIDGVVWAAGQTGSWYGDTHRAWSAAFEGGYRWRSGWQPWVRAGYLHASGDSDPSDARHGTFFLMLPTVRRYSFTTVYAPMNLRDAFIESILSPTPRVRARVDVHRLLLADSADRWYAGSGATMRSGSFFGYAARPSAGHSNLGTAVEGALEVTITRHWSVNGFVGYIDAGPVVASLFAGTHLRYGYLENVLRF
jgi:hypothetical protein